MLNRIIGAAILLLLAACAAANQQQSLRELEERWLREENNPDALESILADDFIHVLPMGFITKAEQLQFMRAHPAPPNAEQRRFENLRVRVFGNTGVATGTVVATGADGHVRKTNFTDVFVRRSGRWQAVNAQELTSSP